MTTTPEIPDNIIIEAFSDSLTDEVTPTTAFEKSAVIFYDAVLTVYLCAAPNSESLLAVRRPAQVAESALLWADGQDLSPTSPDFAELLALFGQIMQEITASTSEPVPQATDPAQKKIP